jgi:hypothetical protein
MTRTTRRIAFALICLVLAAGVVYYAAPWQQLGQQQEQPGGKGKG